MHVCTYTYMLLRLPVCWVQNEQWRHMKTLQLGATAGRSLESGTLGPVCMTSEARSQKPPILYTRYRHAQPRKHSEEESQAQRHTPAQDAPLLGSAEPPLPTSPACADSSADRPRKCALERLDWLVCFWCTADKVIHFSLLLTRPSKRLPQTMCVYLMCSHSLVILLKRFYIS